MSGSPTITTVNLPQARLPVLNPDGTFNLYWYRFFQQSSGGGSVDPAIIAAIENQLAVIDNEITNINNEIANLSTVKNFDVNNYLEPSDLTYDAPIVRCLAANNAAYFPPNPKLGGNSYLINNSILLNSEQILLGASYISSVIACQTANVPTVVLSSQIFNYQISNLIITHSVTPVAGGHGLSQGQGLMDWVNDGLIENVQFTNNWIGANLGKCFFCRVVNSDCSSNLSGAWIMTSGGFTTVPSGSANGPLQWYFSNCSAGSNGGDAFAYISTATSATTISVGTLTACTTFANAGHGVAAYGNSNAGISSVRVIGGFYGEDQLHEIYLDSYSNRHVIKPDYIELAGSGFSVDITDPACGIYTTFNGTSGNQNTDTIIHVGQINGCTGDGMFIQSPDCQILGGIITNNGLGGVSGRQNGIYFFGLTGQVVGVLAKDTGAGTQQIGISCNHAGMQVTGCTLLGNIAGAVAFPSFVGDTSTTIVGCLPLNINQVFADQLHVYGSGTFLGSGGTAGTLGVNIQAGGLAMLTGIVGNGIVSDNIEARFSLAAASTPTGVAGDLVAINANITTFLAVPSVHVHDIQVSVDLSTTGGATTHLTAGAIAMSGGVTISSGAMTFTSVAGNDLTVDNVRINTSLGVGVAASGVVGQIDLTTAIKLNGVTYTNP